MLKHIGKEKQSIDVTVVVHSVVNLGQYAGTSVFFSWKRGNNKKSGTTQNVVVSIHGEADFRGEMIKFTSNFYCDAQPLLQHQQPQHRHSNSSIGFGTPTCMCMFTTKNSNAVCPHHSSPAIAFSGSPPSSSPTSPRNGLSQSMTQPSPFSTNAGVIGAAFANIGSVSMEKKILEMTLMQNVPSKNKPRAVGRLIINIGDYANKTTTQPTRFSFSSWKSLPKPDVLLSFKCLLAPSSKSNRPQTDGSPVTSGVGLETQVESDDSTSDGSLDSAGHLDMNEKRQRHLSLPQTYSSSYAPEYRTVYLHHEHKTSNSSQIQSMSSQHNRMPSSDSLEPMGPQNLEDSIKTLAAENQSLLSVLEDTKKELQKYPNVSLKLPEMISRVRTSGKTVQNNNEMETREKAMRLAFLEQEREKFLFIEKEIYLVNPAIINGVPSSSKIIFNQLSHWNAFSENNFQLLDQVADAIENTCMRDFTSSSQLCFWLSSVCGLLSYARHPSSPPSHDRVEESSSRETISSTPTYTTTPNSKAKTPYCPRGPGSPDHTLPLRNSGTITTLPTATTTTTTNVTTATTSQPNSYITTSQTIPPPTQLVSLTYFDTRLVSVAFKIFSLILELTTTEIEPHIIPILLYSSTFPESSKTRQRILRTEEMLTRPLGNTFISMRNWAVPEPILVQFFFHVMHFISATLFNYLISHKEECMANSGLQLKMSLSKITDWLAANHLDMKVIVPGLNPIKEVSSLFLMNKVLLVEEDTLKYIFPSLRPRQVYHLLKLFDPPAPPDVLLRLQSFITASSATPQSTTATATATATATTTPSTSHIPSTEDDSVEMPPLPPPQLSFTFL